MPLPWAAWQLVTAATMIVIVPVLFLIFQKPFVAGYAHSGLKQGRSARSPSEPGRTSRDQRRPCPPERSGEAAQPRDPPIAEALQASAIGP